jgi:Tfp pilus assembly protein PilN
MNIKAPLDLNLATRPRRNRRLYSVLARVLAVCCIGLAGGTAYVVLELGSESSRLKSVNAEQRKLKDEADREQRRLVAEVRRQERLGQPRVDLVNGIILRKTFQWTALLSGLERALPASSYITSLNPGFTPEGAVALRMSVTSRSLEDLTALIDSLNGGGFKNIQVYGESRSGDGRIITEISLTYERAF